VATGLDRDIFIGIKVDASVITLKVNFFYLSLGKRIRLAVFAVPTPETGVPGTTAAAAATATTINNAIPARATASSSLSRRLCSSRGKWASWPWRYGACLGVKATTGRAATEVRRDVGAARGAGIVVISNRSVSSTSRGRRFLGVRN
jgi:hypothetical protein